MNWHFWKASQRGATVFVFLSARAVGDENNPERSDTDTMVLTYSKASAAQTNPQFVAMVKREVALMIGTLNTASNEADVSATFAV